MNDRSQEVEFQFENYLKSITPENFEHTALEVFRRQYSNNPVYHDFVDYLGVSVDDVSELKQVPFMPISFFKNQTIKSGSWEPEDVFESSGTTGATSRHLVKNKRDYLLSCKLAFEEFYGPVEDFTLLAVLPSYLERKGSSLIAMIDYFITASKPNSGFFLYDYDQLVEIYADSISQNQKVLIWGVSFALMDMIEKDLPLFEKALIMETGGMKGRRKELVRQDMHEILTKGLGVSEIHSEYGMTELFGQAYSKGDGIFSSPSWLKIVVRDISDPLTLNSHEKVGGVNVIDLSNLHSCSFIATDDLGKTHENGTFEITGRLDNSDIRGCNLMIN